MNETIKQAAQEFGKALAETALTQEFRQAEQALAADAELLRLKAEVEQVYDDLTQRQTAGENVARGEIEAYYELEQSVLSNPLLLRRDASLEKLKDFYSEANFILSGRLGIDLIDLIKS